MVFCYIKMRKNYLQLGNERNMTMNLAAVYHKTTEQYSYPLNKDELIISLKTGYDVDKVWIIYGDPYVNGIAGGKEAWEGQKEEVVFKKRLKEQIWWTTTIRPPFKRLKYYFILENDKEQYAFYENGFLTEDQSHSNNRIYQYFTFPWMNEKDIAKTPDWVNEMVWYQIFPERFCNGNPNRSPEGVKEWRNGPVSNEEFFGGDLEGIISKLDYLKDLGITGIYLTPIFTSPSSHKYNIEDYREIDPHFGDSKVFEQLVQELHKRNMRIMLDGVFNHCGERFGLWLDVLEKGPQSPYYNWFMVNQWPLPEDGHGTRDGRFYSFAFTEKMPKLNTNNPEVIEYFSDICAEWVEKYGIDGWRFDVGNEVSHDFLRQIRTRIKGINPEVYLLGEIWHDASNYLMGDQYDAVMNYPLTSSLNDFWIDDNLTKEDFEYTLNRCYTMYMQQVNNVLFNLLDSHDTDRLFTRVARENCCYQQLAVLFTVPGSPCIYYGTEIGMEGKHDPDCRRCMPWDEIEQGMYNTHIDIIKRLIHLRTSNPAFRSPYFHFTQRYSNPRVFEYIKLNGLEPGIEIVLNCSDIPELVEGQGELFSIGYEDGILKPDGVIIRTLSE